MSTRGFANGLSDKSRLMLLSARRKRAEMKRAASSAVGAILATEERQAAADKKPGRPRLQGRRLAVVLAIPLLLEWTVGWLTSRVIGFGERA